MHRYCLFFLFYLSLTLFFSCKPKPRKQDIIHDFVHKKDEAFKYDIVQKGAGDGWIEYHVKMISGTWLTEAEVDETEWWHWLTIIVPKDLQESESLMVISGGNKEATKNTGAPEPLTQIALATNSIVAEISNIPFQAIDFKNDEKGDRYEDDIIAYGWRRFLEGGAKDEDAKWLARLPMTRAVVKAMDVVQEISKNHTIAVDSFVVTGASKRGWTTWTTAIIDDRVMAIIPVVIDLLNVVPSFNHHWQVYGKWSPAIQDYVEEGIMEWQGSAEYDRLLELVEPYSFREQLDLPKFIINATGDEFFVTDSWQFYWDDLVGPKYLQYIPNANHSLNGSYNLQSLAAFYEATIKDKPIPRFAWRIDKNSISISVDPQTDYTIKKWEAYNPITRDFRVDIIGETWQTTAISKNESGKYSIIIDEPTKGFKAGMVEIIFNPKSSMPLIFSSGTVVTPDSYSFETYEPQAPKGIR